jgi:hypothetical protein
MPTVATVHTVRLVASMPSTDVAASSLAQPLPPVESIGEVSVNVKESDLSILVSLRQGLAYLCLNVTSRFRAI